MTRYKTWVKQGRYRAQGFQGTPKGTPMVLVLDKETGATVLEPLKVKRTSLNKTKSNSK